MWVVLASMPVIAGAIIVIGSLMNGATLDVEEIRYSFYGLGIAAAIAAPIYSWIVWRTRRFARKIEAMSPGAAIIVGEAAEVTSDDLSGNLVRLESGWLQTSAVVVLPNRLEVWGKDADEADLVLDRSRLQVRTVDIWVSAFNRGHNYVGVWATDGDYTIVVVPTSRNARSTDRALSQALADLGEDVSDPPHGARQ
ncbi:hypothetical protein [Nocardioides sp. YR527]|uniref:hypothetical protein n=1 Tax=Nocardioides sp. YR527 TaxID=1881028 RepID=UPI00115FA50B|nr:hypothetical protein [Nocardioides sp. YR527]